MNNRTFGFFSMVFAAVIFLLLVSASSDPYFISSINGNKSGEVPPRDVVIYQYEGDLVIRKNGSINIYEPAQLYCVSKSGSLFSVGSHVSDSVGVMHTIETSGYLELKGSRVDCHIKSMTEKPFSYSTFYSYQVSGLIIMGIMFSIFYLVILFIVGIVMLLAGSLD